ncbi:MAG: GTPase ObgE [Chthoniobacterales bacterium]|nr:GTPase ObgE [Chthoniobacterales bacterium]
MDFVDQVRIYAKAGNGGNGCCSFRREKFVPRGGPDGGNGGNGGNVVLVADPDITNLVSLYYEPILRAKNGSHGQGSNKHGRSAPDLQVPVPLGTIVYSLPPQENNPLPFDLNTNILEKEPLGNQLHPTHCPTSKNRIDPRQLTPLVDLTLPGQKFILCRGGRGGRGNASFKSSINRAPRQFTRGQPGEEGWFLLELQSIAFAGLVGFPNAGKSSLLNAISHAHPKIAPYPFTTRSPHIGVVQLDDFHRTTIADIPGLIEGASQNRGLGYDFLRHILRCQHLLFVLDAAATEGRDPLQDLVTLRDEIALYDPSLPRKPWSILANKTDLPEATHHIPRIQQAFPNHPLIPISAKFGIGLDLLKKHLLELTTTLSKNS